MSSLMNFNCVQSWKFSSSCSFVSVCVQECFGIVSLSSCTSEDDNTAGNVVSCFLIYVTVFECGCSRVLHF